MHECLPRLFADDHTIRNHPDTVRRVLERVAVEQRDVGVLSNYQRPDTIVDPEEPSRIDRDHGQSLFEREPVRGSNPRFKEHDTRPWNIALKPTLKRDRDPGFLQRRGRLEAQVLGLAGGASSARSIATILPRVPGESPSGP